VSRRPADLLKALGERVREIRTGRGLSQEKVGERADLHRNEIGVIERGETNISFVNLLRICRALEVTPSELLAPFVSDWLEKLPPKRPVRHREK
jgi:transcriptional regulator with XRE-family HTH domain